MYVTRKPCLSCYHMILTAGIPEVCYPDKGKLLTERAMER
jgi:deoxycytidylate deaminase